eukprot:Em0003g652a
MSTTGNQPAAPTVDERSKLIRGGELRITTEGTVDQRSAAVKSGEVLVRKDGQVDERSKAVKQGEHNNGYPACLTELVEMSTQLSRMKEEISFEVFQVDATGTCIHTLET